MANDRVILHCVCGERITLGKYYPTIDRYGVDTSGFVTKHLASCVKGFPFDLEGQNPFSISLESEHGFRDPRAA